MREQSSVQEGVLVVAFTEEGAAAEALERLKKAKKDKTFDFWDAAEEEVEAAIQKLSDGIADNMEHGQNVAYHVTAAGRSVSCHQLGPYNALVEMLGI